MYVVYANVVKTVNGQSIGRGIPTFYLNENVQGIVDVRHAELIAREILEPWIREHEEIRLHVAKVS